MNDEQRFERAARTWLEDGPERAPDRAVDAALDRIQTTTQERDLRAPWRFPQMPMLFRAAAAAIVIAVVAGGALLLLRGPASPGVASLPTASPSPIPSPSPSPMSLDAYVTAYNATCDEAGVATEPLRPRFLERYDGSITDAQRADWTDALVQLHDRTIQAADELAALTPPEALAEGHARTVQDLRDELALVQDVATALREHRDADALAANQATEPLGDRIFNWENQHVLHHCP
jgi:hypothetical protein